MSTEELLKQFGEHIGIRHLRLEVNRSCQLRFGDDLWVIINEVNAERLLLNAVVGRIPPQTADQLAFTLLNMNMLFAHVEGPYVTCEPERNIIMLSRALEIAGLDVLAIEENISYLLQNVEHIRVILQEKGISLDMEDVEDLS
ncbi:hypothetical protein VL10_23970 [Leclercia adecarboxylata]|nr:hypothetical protein VL10_23970 [Leclercia adecarboxylata]KMN66738.1 hypothetical protein VK95_04410 [Leclercia sp. LK8]